MLSRCFSCCSCKAIIIEIEKREKRENSWQRNSRGDRSIASLSPILTALTTVVSIFICERIADLWRKTTRRHHSGDIDRQGVREGVSRLLLNLVELSRTGAPLSHPRCKYPGRRCPPRTRLKGTSGRTKVAGENESASRRRVKKSPDTSARLEARLSILKIASRDMRPF